MNNKKENKSNISINDQLYIFWKLWQSSYLIEFSLNSKGKKL